MAKVLVANRDALPIPQGITDQVNPTIDIFGSQRAGEIQVADVLGVTGALEAFHTRVPEDSVRQYLSMEFFCDDPTDRRMRAGRIFTTSAGFPFAGMQDEVVAVAGEIHAVRNFTVPPLARAAVQVDGIAIGARLRLTVVWIETPLGEYVNSIE